MMRKFAKYLIVTLTASNSYIEKPREGCARCRRSWQHGVPTRRGACRSPTPCAALCRAFRGHALIEKI